MASDDTSDDTPPPKNKKIQIKVDEALRDQANAYAKDKGVSLGALIRALLRIQTEPSDPRPLPPGMEAERKRPPRSKKGQKKKIP